MASKSLKDINGSFELYRHIMSLKTVEAIESFFDDPLFNDVNYLSKIDPDSNLPIAHTLIACPRFVLSKAAQNPDILNIKNKLGYPLSFRLMYPIIPNQVIPGLNANDPFIQQLLEKQDPRVSFLNTGALPKSSQDALKRVPHRLWLFTDAAKDKAVIDKRFTAMHDNSLWHFKYTEGKLPEVYLSPMEAIIAGSFAYKDSREIVNLAYHQHSEIISALEAYAELDKFSNSTPGFLEGYPSVGAANSVTFVRLALHYQAENKSLLELKKSSFDFIGKNLVFAADFHEEFSDYLENTMQKCAETLSNNPADEALVQNQIRVFKQNLGVFKSLIKSDPHQSLRNESLFVKIWGAEKELESIEAKMSNQTIELVAPQP
jgi:hypothetical protein